MANICSAGVVFYGPEEDIKTLHDKLMEWTSEEWASKNSVENDYGPKWLGNVLHGVGIPEFITDDSKINHIDCRGTMDFISDIFDVDVIPKAWPKDLSTTGLKRFSLMMFSEWRPYCELISAVISNLKLNIKFAVYFAESGMGMYGLYDPYQFDEFSRLNFFIEVIIDKVPDEIIEAFNEIYTTDICNTIFKEQKDGSTRFAMSRITFNDEIIKILQIIMQTNVDKINMLCEMIDKDFYNRFGSNSSLRLCELNDTNFDVQN